MHFGPNIYLSLTPNFLHDAAPLEPKHERHCLWLLNVQLVTHEIVSDMKSEMFKTRAFSMPTHYLDFADTRAARRRRCSSGRRRPAPPLRPARRPSAARQRTTRRRTATTTAPCRSAPRPSNCCWPSLARAHGPRRYAVTAAPMCNLSKSIKLSKD